MQNSRPAIVYDELLNASQSQSLKLSKVVTLWLYVSLLVVSILENQELMMDLKHLIQWFIQNLEIIRIGKTAFELAMKRDKRVCSVDKANVLEVSQLWRDTMNELSSEYPEVELSHMYVDNAAMQLIRNPKQFDVIVTWNIFGDILKRYSFYGSWFYWTFTISFNWR